MRTRVIGLSLALSLSLISAYSATPPKAGSVCSKQGITKIYKGKRFTCIKSGKKLVWSKGVVIVVAPKPSATPIATPSPTPSASPSPTVEPVPTPSPSVSPTPTTAPITAETYSFTNICDPDPFVPNLWKPFQDKELELRGCPPPYRYLSKQIPVEVPVNQQTDRNKLTDVMQCKNDSTRSWTSTGFLGPEAKKIWVIQVVPFYMNEGMPTTTPQEDWQAAINFALDAWSAMSDHPLKIKVKLPDTYYRVNGDLKDYGLGSSVMHGDPKYNDKRWELIEKVVTGVDPRIDFAEADMVWFLTSSKVKRSLLSNQIAHSRVIKTAEKNFSIHTSTYISSPINDFSSDFPRREPFGFIHEFMHITDALDDHYGTGPENPGTGSWGNMSGAMLDFLAWDKWSLGWINNSQVRCAPQYSTSVHWIKPSTITGAHEKLLMIPINRTQSIAVESIRNSGFNLKLPVSMLGALVYTVDTKLLDDRTKHGLGLSVVCPSRGCTSSAIPEPSFKLAGATLKPGEFVETMGYRITVIESGSFGDVVKVERIAPIPAPSNFSDLYENRAGISQSAWSKSSGIIKASKGKGGVLEIYTGPNTKPYFGDYPSAIDLVSRLFPNRSVPAKTIVIRFNFKDLDWAENITREKLSAADYDQIQRSENNQFVGGNCDSATANCRGAREQTGNSGVSIIMQGVENQLDSNDPNAKSRTYSGMVEAHEFFHSLQRIPIRGKSNIWPHAWFREGSANWVQNASMNHMDFVNYEKYLKLDCNNGCTRLSEADIVEFLEKSDGESAGPKFDRWLNYSLGSHIVEALVAIKGPDTLIEMYAQMGTQINFASAFKNTYGVEWSYAIPILAKTIYANLKGL